MLSRLILFWSIILVGLIATLTNAHGIKPAIVEYQYSDGLIEINLTINAELFLSGIDASQFVNTANAPEAKIYDQLRLLDAKELESQIKNSESTLKEKLYLKVDQELLSLDLDKISVEITDIKENVRMTRVSFKTTIPKNSQQVTFSWEKELGPLIFRNLSSKIIDGKSTSKWLKAGEETDPLLLNSPRQNSSRIVLSAIHQGIKHIIPEGLDHILFVLGLFFFSRKMGPLLSQVTVFTLAHSVTLILGSLGYISLPTALVEAVIAASIVWIGLENVVRTKLNFSRIGLIFCFGLLHGLGFASMFTQIGLEGSDYLLNLFSFNIGIEIGQIIVLIPFILAGTILSKLSWYRLVIAIPASIIIAIIGIKIFIDRVI